MTSCKSSVPVLEDDSGAFVQGFIDKANLLQSVFSGKFVTNNGSFSDISNKCRNAANKLIDLTFTPVGL